MSQAFQKSASFILKFFFFKETALKKLDEATKYFSQLFNNNTEDVDLLEVSKNMLLAVGNILKSSSEDAKWNSQKMNTEKVQTSTLLF